MATRLRWLGHSCLWIESDGLKLLVDPFLTGNPKAVVAADDIDPDFICVSHGHGDHVGDTIAIAKRTGATVICNYEISQWLDTKHVKTHGMQHGGAFRFPFGRVKLTLAFHGSVLPDGSNGGNPCGFHWFFNDGSTIYDAADTGLFGDMALIGDEGVDLALLPIGDNYTMGPEDALRAVKLIRPKLVVPIHFGTFDLIGQDAEAWGRAVATQSSTIPHILQPGEWVTIRA